MYMSHRVIILIKVMVGHSCVTLDKDSKTSPYVVVL